MDGATLYSKWQLACSSDLDSWEQLTDEAREDWETFAQNLRIDYGLGGD